MKLVFRIIFKISLLLTILVGCAATEEKKETDSIAHLNQGIFFIKKGEYDQSIACFNKAIALNPKLTMAYNSRGFAFAQGKGQCDKAISDYSKAIEINPSYAAAYNNRGLIYCRCKGHFDRAISDFNKAIKINPSFADAYNNRGITYFYLREYDRAWDDAYKAKNLGYKVHPGFLKALRQASGRQK